MAVGVRVRVRVRSETEDRSARARARARRPVWEFEKPECPQQQQQRHGHETQTSISRAASEIGGLSSPSDLRSQVEPPLLAVPGSSIAAPPASTPALCGGSDSDHTAFCPLLAVHWVVSYWTHPSRAHRHHPGVPQGRSSLSSLVVTIAKDRRPIARCGSWQDKPRIKNVVVHVGAARDRCRCDSPPFVSVSGAPYGGASSYRSQRSASLEAGVCDAAQGQSRSVPGRHTPEPRVHGILASRASQTPARTREFIILAMR